MATSQKTWKSREEFKAAKALEEARKAGTALPEVDEEGVDINPHIPQYISKLPWYYEAEGPTLRHQKKEEKKKTPLDVWYPRGKFAVTATKYRKGSCTNCGAMTHSAKFCTERPRKIGAKYSGKDICPDEVIADLELDYEAKRDRWNGYSPDDYKKVMELMEKTEAERRKKKELEQAQKFLNKEKQDPDEEEEDDYKLDGSKDDAGQFSKRDIKARTTVRNLRIREDTAKYLLNLDPNSAYYAPKSRSMRDNPHPDKDPSEVTFMGENHIRFTGETKELYELQKFAWETRIEGQEIDPVAIPSLASVKYKEYKKEKEEKK